MTLYRYQLDQQILLREREVGDSPAARLVPVGPGQNRVFVGQPGLISAETDSLDTVFITVLQDVPDEHNGHAERLLLTRDKDTKRGIEWSIASGREYANIDGSHLFVNSFTYDGPEDYQGDARPLGSEPFDVSSFDSIEFPLGDHHAYLGGMVTDSLQGLPTDATFGSPYIILISTTYKDRKDMALFFWSRTDKRWKVSPVTALQPRWLQDAKVVACTNDQLLNGVLSMFDQAVQIGNGDDLTQISPAPIRAKPYNGDLRNGEVNRGEQVAEYLRDRWSVEPGDSHKKIGLGPMAIHYFRRIPRLVSESDFKGHIRDKFDRLVKSSLVDSETLRAVLFEVARWPRFDPELSEVLLEGVIPNLLSIASLYRSEMHKPSFDLALQQIARQAGLGRVHLLSPLCPPYTYVARNGFLTHYSGELQPIVGPRFGISLKTISTVFEPLRQKGVKTDLTVVTYTGETGDIRDLVDLGEDVVTHYQGRQDQIFTNLRSTTDSIGTVGEEVLVSHGWDFNLVSVELALGRKIAEQVKEFRALFGDRLDLADANSQKVIGDWLEQRYGVREGWLLYFIEQEVGYRTDKAELIDTNIAEGVVVNALREGLLYLHLTQYARRYGYTILDLETTANYMMGSLRHYPAPCMLGNAFDSSQALNRTNIRQPFNLPVEKR